MALRPLTALQLLNLSADKPRRRRALRANRMARRLLIRTSDSHTSIITQMLEAFALLTILSMSLVCRLDARDAGLGIAAALIVLLRARRP